MFNEVGISNWLALHWPLIGGIAIVLFGAFFVWLAVRNQTISGERGWLSYLLVWPLIFEIEKASKKKTSAKFIVIGLIVLLLLVIFSLVTYPNVR